MTFTTAPAALTSAPAANVAASPGCASYHCDAMTPQPSRLTIDASGDRALAASGVVDAHTAAQLLVELQDLGGGGDITLDLSQVEFIDSSGLRTLVTSHQELEADGHKLVLSGISDAVDRLFEITGLREHLHIS